MKSFLTIYVLLSLSLLQTTFVAGIRCPMPTYQCSASSTGTKTLIFDFGDVNGDGRVDYIQRPQDAPASCADDNTVLMLATPTGGFTPYYLSCSLAFKGQNTVLTFADFNGDGKKDILRRESTLGDGIVAAEILYYQGGSSFERVPLPDDFQLQNDANNVFIADFNGDGKADFLRQEKFSSGPVKLFLSNGGGSFTVISLLPSENPLYYSPGPYTNLYIGDFNGDGKSDVFRQEKADFVDYDDVGTASIWTSLGDGTFSVQELPSSLNLKGNYVKLHLGDFNGDCKTDILAQRNSASSLLLSDGNQGFTSIDLSTDYNIHLAFINLFIGDFNCDGKSDFLKQENGNNPLADVKKIDTYLSTGDSNNPFELVSLFTSPKSSSSTAGEIYVGDFGGAGRTSYFQYWGGQCLEFFNAPQQGTCTPSQCPLASGH